MTTLLNKYGAYWLSLLLIISIFGNIFLYYRTQSLEKLRFIDKENQTVQQQTLMAQINILEKEREDTLSILELNEEEKEKLADRLEREREKVEEIEEDYKRINETVGQLVKLSETDEELLQKYSKVYFLNENYTPDSLGYISQKNIHGSKSLQIHGEVLPFLRDMIKDAEDDNISLEILSAYRSFQYQQQIKQTYVTMYGSGANKFSADQGYSEHQLGTTVDFTNKTIGSSLSLFENTEEFKWLEKRAYKHGFVLSYPKNNSFYQYEPWHWRFVGKDLAKYLHKNDLYFYDLDQRDIDEYLIEIFED